MRVITETCDECGTIVAGNVLLNERVIPCPGFNCNSNLTFKDLSAEERSYLQENSKLYEIN